MNDIAIENGTSQIYSISKNELSKVTIETLSDINDVNDGLKALMNLRDDNIETARVLIDLKIIDFSRYEEVPSNPVVWLYDDWDENWRFRSISTSFEWRTAMNTYHSVTDNIRPVTSYLNGLSAVSCVVYDKTVNTPMNAIQLSNVSSYVNSIGRPDLQTHVVGDKVALI